MKRNKKLQVFVSSTFTDLKTERQAAVEAILAAGHIPAGMELFTAGDESQMSVIKRWIDESDVYLLILGGRYGSIEPNSQKSYTHLEYEYALDQGKPLFGVVIKDSHLEEKVKQFGREVIEIEQPQKLKDFRNFVCSKMVEFWNDPRDIKLAILKKMNEFNRRDDVIGWIPGNEAVNTASLAVEIARLSSENAELRAKNTAQPEPLYSGLTFDQLYTLLNVPLSNFGAFDQSSASILIRTRDDFGDSEPTRLHYFVIVGESVATGNDYYLITGLSEDTIPFFTLGLMASVSSDRSDRLPETTHILTESGQRFLSRLVYQRGKS